MPNINSVIDFGWISGIVFALIGLIYVDMKKQIGESLDGLKKHIEKNSNVIQENTRSAADLTAKIAVMSERMESIRREHAISIDTITEKIKNYEARFENVKERVNDLSTSMGQIVSTLKSHPNGHAFNKVKPVKYLAEPE